MIDWKAEIKPIIALSPMADMTDSAFCFIAKQAGCQFVYREMISAEAVVRQNTKTLKMAEFSEQERPIIQQLFGADPTIMAEAVRIIDEKYQPDAFDINMGCPAVKIISTFNGSALMKEPKKAAKIVQEMKKATTKQVSVKTRLGWSNPEEILEFAKVLEEAGANMIAIHGRTKTQGYAGKANWNMVGRVKQSMQIPILVNGDITTPELALSAIKSTHCDGMLIGRGALGNPWIFNQINCALNGLEIISPNQAEIIDMVIKHAKLHAELYGGDKPLISFRKHLVCYFKGVPGAKELREKLVRVETINDLESILLTD